LTVVFIYDNYFFKVLCACMGLCYLYFFVWVDIVWVVWDFHRRFIVVRKNGVKRKGFKQKGYVDILREGPRMSVDGTFLREGDRRRLGVRWFTRFEKRSKGAREIFVIEEHRGSREKRVLHQLLVHHDGLYRVSRRGIILLEESNRATG